jgi:hypothetical protein
VISEVKGEKRVLRCAQDDINFKTNGKGKGKVNGEQRVLRCAQDDTLRIRYWLEGAAAAAAEAAA